VDTPAERRQDAHPPVADLVAEPLDHDGAVGRHRRAALLLAQERQKVPARERVEVVFAPQSSGCALVGERDELA